MIRPGYYDYAIIQQDDLKGVIHAINTHGDRIIAVTQDGDMYTIFFQVRG